MPSSASSSQVPLSVLDLVPVPSGATAADALRNTVELAQRAEESGYHRYWIAEHHLHPGVAGTSPALVISLVAGATRRIRVGSGAVQMGHHTPLSVVEQFGIIDALHPGRIDLGLGRSGLPRQLPKAAPDGEPDRQPGAPPPEGTYTANGLYLPPKFTGLAKLLKSPAFSLLNALLQQPGAETPAYTDQVDEILALLAGTYRTPEGVEAHPVPGAGAGLEVWILGSSGGDSARAAGARGLPFAANYHVSPGTVIEAVESYREAFRPSDTLAEPRVMISADAVVGPDDVTARRLAAGYGVWVRSIRRGEGAVPFPTPEEAAALEWTPEDRELVTDRLDSQFTGSAETVAERLGVLREATGADELLVTTITHDHEDRVRSYESLARAWAKQG